MELKINQAWKCIPKNMTSHGHKWELNKWYSVKGKIKMCNNGFHASNTILDAWSYVEPEWICVVEYKGEKIDQSDKFVVRSMRVIKKFKWCKKDSLRFALYCLKRSMKCFDRKKFPKVWEVFLGSIKAVETVLLRDTKKSRDVAKLVAESAAWSATMVAESSSRTSWSELWSAARETARVATMVAESAWSAAKSAESAWLIAESTLSATESATMVAKSAKSTAKSARLSAKSAWASEKKIQEKWLQKYLKQK